MSYNIIDIETKESSLKMTVGAVKKALAEYDGDMAEICFLYDYLDEYAANDLELDIPSISWSGGWSGRSLNSLKKILSDFTTGTGKFVITWEDGARSGLAVEGEGVSRRVRNAEVKTTLE